MYYNGTMKDVNSSTTNLTFTAPSLPDGVFSGTVVVIVTAVNRFGIGPASDPVTAIIGKFNTLMLHSYVNTYILAYLAVAHVYTNIYIWT